MGKEHCFNPCQRGQDAGQKAPMRTPKRLYTEAHIISYPELLSCPHYGAFLVMWNYLAWDTTVQTLERVVSIATRPGHCPKVTGPPGSHMRLLSVQAQQIALPGFTYGDAVVARLGWRCQQDQTTFETFLQPLHHLEWPLLAVLSDKQTGLVPAIASVLPHSRHPLRQAHYLRNLAEPLAGTDAACKVELRKTVRQHVGDLLRPEPRPTPDQAGVLTVTTLVPSRLETPLGAAAHSPPPHDNHTAPGSEAEEVITQRFRHPRYLLTLTGRPPFHLAGEVQPGAVWLGDIADIFAPSTTQPVSARTMTGQLQGSLDTGLRLPALTPPVKTFGSHLAKVSRNYWPGLFHCYDMPSLPRTTNALASRFRVTARRLLRTTGQKGLTQRMLQRRGAWELLPRPSTEP